MIQGLMAFLALWLMIKLEGNKSRKGKSKDDQYFFFENFIDRK